MKWAHRVGVTTRVGVVLIGLSGLFFWLTGASKFSNPAVVLFSSPLPAVFHQPEFAAHYRYTVETSTGKRMSGLIGPEMLGRLEGPLAARLPYFLPIFIRQFDSSFLNALYSFGLCEDDAFLLRLFEPPEPVRSVQLEVECTALCDFSGS